MHLSPWAASSRHRCRCAAPERGSGSAPTTTAMARGDRLDPLATPCHFISTSLLELTCSVPGEVLDRITSMPRIFGTGSLQD